MTGFKPIKGIGPWILAVAWLVAPTLGVPEPAAGDVYQYVDANGVVHFTNVPTDPRYRPLFRGTAAASSRPKEIHQMIHGAARRHGLDPALVKAVVKVESDFDPSAVSTAGAMGLMQLMPATAAHLGVINPFSPAENIEGGTRHLGRLLDQFKGDLSLSLAAYHAGAKKVEAYGQVPPIQQTQSYVRKVLAAYRSYLGPRTGPKTTYKVISPDGRVIYTNVPEQYQGSPGYRVATVK